MKAGDAVSGPREEYVGQHVDERAARGRANELVESTQDLGKTEASHCKGSVSSALAVRVRRTRWGRRGADTAQAESRDVRRRRVLT